MHGLIDFLFQLHANAGSLIPSAQLSHPVSFAQNTTELYQEAEVWPGNFHQGPGFLGYTDLGVLSSEFRSVIIAMMFFLGLPAC